MAVLAEDEESCCGSGSCCCDDEGWCSGRKRSPGIPNAGDVDGCGCPSRCAVDGFEGGEGGEGAAGEDKA